MGDYRVGEERNGLWNRQETRRPDAVAQREQAKALDVPQHGA